MKKTISVLLAALLLLSLTACGTQKATDEQKIQYAGMLTAFDKTEEEANSMKRGETVPHEGALPEGAPAEDAPPEGAPAGDAPAEDMTVVFYDDLQSLVLALQVKKVSCMRDLPLNVANYIAANNESFKVISNETVYRNVYMNFCFGAKEDNTELIALLNKGIASLSENGTLDSLKAEHIDVVVEGDAPAVIDLPVIEGAETYRVVVTGDMPPLDYVSADGSPAGFNVALLAALSNELNINFKLVTSNAGSRVSMLASGKADVIFWMRNSHIQREDGSALTIMNESPEGIIISDAYYTDSVTDIVLK